MELRLRLTLVLPMLLLLGCQHNLSSEHYTRDDLNNAMNTYYGKVESIRTVVVSDTERAADSKTGMIAGGAIGSAFGSTVKKKKSSDALETLLGAAVGAFAQGKLSKQQANEYLVLTESGKMFTVVQKDDYNLNPGDQVVVVAYKYHRSRLYPRET